MMARCGRPELDSCPRVVGRGASARKRHRLVLAPPKCARNPPDQTQEEAEPTSQQPKAGTAKQPRAQRARLQNSRKPKQPAARTAWKPSLQKTGTAEERTAKQPGLPRCRAVARQAAQCAAGRVDGVEAVPPEGGNSQTAAEPTAWLAAPPRGRRGSRPSKRQEQPKSEQPNSPGLNAPGYRTAEQRGRRTTGARCRSGP